MQLLTQRLANWFRWVIVTATGWATGMVVASSFLAMLGVDMQAESAMYVLGAVGGLGVGAAQWMYVQREIRSIWLWLVSTMGAWLLGMLIVIVAIDWWRAIAGWLLAGATAGLVVGFCQRFSLHFWQKHLVKWLLRSVTSWTGAYVLGSLLVRDEIAAGVPFAPGAIAMQGAVGWSALACLAFVFLLTVFPARRDPFKLRPMRWSA